MKKLILYLLAFSWLASCTAARQQLIISSTHLSKPDTTWVFTPSGYEKSELQSYPVVYLLHGWSGSYHQWDDIMGCQQYADEYGFILVCPDGLFDSWYINSPALKESQYATFFFHDLLPEIQKKYRVDPSNVFITGLSMGGHGSLYLFSQQPGVFKSAGSLSGVVDLSDCPDDYGIPRYLGLNMTATDQAKLFTYSVVGNLDKIAASGKEIIFSCGREDRFYKINTELKAKCDELGISATFIPGPGGHDYPYWKANIREHLDFFSQRVSW